MVANDTNGAFDIFVRNMQTGVMTRASVPSNGLEAHGALTPSIEPPQLALSGDGKLVVFGSEAFDLVANDDNGLADIFVHDLTSGTTTRVSTSKDGAPANGICDQPDISLDGTRVAFSTNSNTLLGGDGNNKYDIYVKVLATGDVLRASLNAAGAELAADARAPSLSGDGRFVAFESVGNFTAAGNGKLQIWVKDLQTGAVEAVSVSSAGSSGGFASAQARISASGQLVLFRSNSTNLVSDDANGVLGDIFLRDRPAGTTVRVDQSLVNLQANGDCFLGDLSADGSHAVFLAAPTTTNLWFGFANSDQNNAADFFVRF
jgi:Tol biopolymer transport system component